MDIASNLPPLSSSYHEVNNTGGVSVQGVKSLGRHFACLLVTTIDLKYNAFRWSSGIIRQLEMSLKFGKSFFHIQAKSRAIEAKKLTPSLEPSRLSRLLKCSVPSLFRRQNRNRKRPRDYIPISARMDKWNGTLQKLWIHGLSLVIENRATSYYVRKYLRTYTTGWKDF